MKIMSRRGVNYSNGVHALDFYRTYYGLDILQQDPPGVPSGLLHNLQKSAKRSGLIKVLSFRGWTRRESNLFTLRNFAGTVAPDRWLEEMKKSKNPMTMFSLLELLVIAGSQFEATNPRDKT